MYRVALWECGARLSPESGFRICNQLLHSLQERRGVWSEVESWGNGEGWQAAEVCKPLKGLNFTTPMGLEPVRLAGLKRASPSAVAVTSETIRENHYL